MGSWRTKSWTLSSGFGYTSLKTDTNQDVGQGSYSTDIAAALSGSTLVFLPSAEWRWGRTTALVLEGRFLMAQKLNGSGTTITQLDEDTTFEMHASGGGDFTVKGLRSFSAGAFWSWDNINLRLGWTFGHLMIPTINAFADTKVQYPDFDLFIRF
ncbi:hypothetical protein KKF91_12390 [Myxococcota bacterium]|nr:hypothetical protein [Myxococcota bacterium]MBU1431331.1 hypothetical protein [Myxococcota bacterium]MBU1900267.1 hypothetical protein [Myxococcota bacterium]